MASMRDAKDGPRYAPDMAAQARRPDFGPGMMARIRNPPDAGTMARNKRATINQTMENVARRAAAATPGSARINIEKGARGYLKKAVSEYENLKANAQGGARKPASKRAMAQVAYTQEENAFKRRNRIK